MIFFLSRRRDRRQVAERLYAATVLAARRPELYLDWEVPDTLRGRFEMTALHLFAVLHRLVHDPGDDPELARLVSEAFVADMDASLREVGVGDMSVPRRVKAFYASFAGRVRAYSHALAEGDEALASAVARNMLPDGAEPRKAERLSTYLRAAVAAMRTVERDRLLRGDLPFPELPRTVGEEWNG